MNLVTPSLLVIKVSKDPPLIHDRVDTILVEDSELQQSYLSLDIFLSANSWLVGLCTTFHTLVRHKSTLPNPPRPMDILSTKL